MSYPILAEKDTWYSNKTTTKRSVFTEINIVDSYTPTGNETESWDGSAAQDRSVMIYVNGTILIIAGNGSGKISLSADATKTFRDGSDTFSNVTTFNGANLFDLSNTTNMNTMCSGFSKLTTLDVSTWDVSSCTDLSSMFSSCKALTALDVSNWNLSSAITISSMFNGCETLASLNVSNWNISNVTTISSMFNGCKALTALDVSNWNTGNVTLANQVFMNCSSLTTLDVSNWDMSNAVEIVGMFNGCKALTALDVSNWNVSKVEKLGISGYGGIFEQCSSLTILDVSNWDVSACQYMESIFWNCSSLTTLDVSNWDVSNVVSMRGMFGSCRLLTNIDVSSWNTSNVKNMQSMFFNCDGLTSLNLSNFNTSNVTTMEAMFQSCEGLTSLNVSSFDTSNVTNMNYMFGGCTSLTSLNLSNFNTSNVTNMGDMFFYCPSLTLLEGISNFDTSNVTNMYYMFGGCTGLTSIDIFNWDVSKVQNMSYLFSGCDNLTTLDVSNWDVSKVETMYAMFYGCSALTSLNTSNWDTSSCKNMCGMFAGCTSLTTLDVSNWDVSKVQTMKTMFQSNESYGNTMKVKLDTSKWDTSSCEDMSFMFYGCGSAQPDVSNWDVSKVKTFDHMFAHSYMESPVDTSKWVTSSATNFNAMFHTVQNKVLDVSNFDTSKVTAFCQMFEYNSVLERIIGLENFDTSQGLGFEQMFNECFKLKCLNLSSFDTRNAKDGVQLSSNGHKSATCEYMFRSMNSLERIVLGENFSFNGDGTTTVAKNVAVLPTPSNQYIPHATGVWYNTARETFAPSEVPSGVAGTYYALDPIYVEGMMVKPESLTAIADQIRTLTNTTEKLNLEQMSSKLSEVTDVYDSAYEAGADSYWNIVWDGMQVNGTRGNYYYFFANNGWNDTNFKPKYDIVPTNAHCMFYHAGITDLVGILKKQGVKLDFSKTTDMRYIAQVAAIKEFGVIDTRSCTGLATTIFGDTYSLHTIEKMIFKDDGSQGAVSMWGQFALRNVTIEGVVGGNYDWTYASNLTKDSILGKVTTDEEVITAGKNLINLNGAYYYGGIFGSMSDTATGKTLKIPAAAINKAFETSSGAKDGSTSVEWTALVGLKSNWTITLL